MIASHALAWSVAGGRIASLRYRLPARLTYVAVHGASYAGVTSATSFGRCSSGTLRVRTDRSRVPPRTEPPAPTRNRQIVACSDAKESSIMTAGVVMSVGIIGAIFTAATPAGSTASKEASKSGEVTPYKLTRYTIDTIRLGPQRAGP